MKEFSTGLCLSLSIVMSLSGLGCEPGGTSALDGEAGEAVYGEGFGALSATPAPQSQSKKPGLKPASAVKSTGTAVRAADVFEKQPEKSSGKVVLTFKSRGTVRVTPGIQKQPKIPSLKSANTVKTAIKPYSPILTLSLTQLLAKSSSQDVVVEKNQDVYIDESIQLGFITVLGTLRCAPAFDGQVQTDGILVMGKAATFSCGTSDQKFAGKAEFVLTNNRELSELLQNPPHMMGGKAIVAMNEGSISMHGETDNAAYTRLNQDLLVGQNKVTIADSVNWSQGDEIVVSTTSFYQNRSELFGLNSANPDQTLTLAQNAGFFHYGKVQDFVDADDGESYQVDERAYVANLTRNIVFMSADDEHTDNRIGAHMMVMHSGSAYIDGVEFFRVGQMGKLGRYPFHWHRAGDVDGQFIRNSSIHESYQRCVTIHGTQNAEVIGNVCYDHFGHGFFLEDGNETQNTIQFNLGIQSKKIEVAKALLVSDFNNQPGDRFPGPATYWISNPNNDVRFNVAVGSEGSGFWMAFKKYLYCDDTGCVKSTQGNANVTPLFTDTDKFSDNVALSTVCGITWDGAPDGPLVGNPNNPDDRGLVNAHYAPATTPSFANLETYKSAKAGVYFRGAQAHFPGSVFADNATSAFFAYNQVISDAIMVGFSDNHNASELDYHYDSAIPNYAQHKKRFEGIRVYDGPFVLDNVFFANYSATPVMKGTLEVTPTPITLTGGASRFVNSVKHVTFSPTPYRKFFMGLGANNWLDSYSAGTRDINGDLTGSPGSILRPAHGMNDFAGCTYLELEKSLVCPYEISHLRINNMGQYSGQNFDVARFDGPSITHDSDPANNEHLNKFSMIMDDSLAYLMTDVDFNNNSQLQMDFTSRNLGDVSPLIAIISGENMNCAVSSLALSKGVAVPGLTELWQAQETAYTVYAGFFLFKLQADSIRPKITPESPQGQNVLNLVCQN
jgi:cell migration-inducing and hyaluronan-binding protein